MAMTDEVFDQETYIGAIRYTLQSMLELSEQDDSYDLNKDIHFYLENKIKPDGILPLGSFWELCNEVGIDITEDE